MMHPDREAALRERFRAERRDPSSVDAGVLDAVDYHYAGRHLDIAIVSEEFTHICPLTGLPDLGRLEIEYVPAAKIIELKSLKYYLLQYRNVGIFYEHVVHRIADDLFAAVAPQRLTVRYRVEPRGGIRSEVSTSRPQSENL